MVINQKAMLEKWSPILTKMGVHESRREWISEYAEYHQIKESVGFATALNVSGMGGVVSPVASSIPGQTTGSFAANGGVAGSGDYGQQLLPVAMKVAAHTIGLDLVAVKPSAGPVIDLMFADFRYDDGNLQNKDNYKPLEFIIAGDDADGKSEVAKFIAALNTLVASAGVKQTSGGLSKRVFLNLAVNSGNDVQPIDPSGDRAAGSVGTAAIDILTEPTGTKEGVIEYLGLSRVSKLPMFRIYRTTNTTAQGIWRYDRTKNTLGELESIVDAFELPNGNALPLYQNKIGFGDTSGALKVELISALEDHLIGAVASGSHTPMTRGVAEETNAGIIAPSMSTKRVQIGEIKISSALQLTEIEDIKAQTGIDIVQKTESVLVNELSQTISKQIVTKLFEMGDLNRQSAPGYNPSLITGGTTSFDFNVDAYLSATAPGGETSQSIQAKLVTKVRNASGYIATEGRVGPATYIVTNYRLAGALLQGTQYSLSPVAGSSASQGQLYPMGKVDGMTVYVDPYMLYNDDRILVGRKNNVDQPGVIFVPYLLAQSINLVSEATFGQRMLLRSRYAITEIGWYPFKSYMTIYVTDTNNILG